MSESTDLRQLGAVKYAQYSGRTAFKMVGANFLKEANSENSDNVPALPYGIGCFGAGDAISAADEFIRSWHTANDTSR
jgi:hypothetical protein